MKFYITQETKQEIEDKIAELKTGLKVSSLTEGFKDTERLSVYQEILSSATIIPVEKSWLKVARKHGISSILSEFYPNGFVISKK